jgi:hypothetical protein
MAISNTVLTSTNPTTVFTAAGQTVISTVYLCNYGVGNVTVDIHAIPGNLAAASSNNIIYSDYLIQTGDTLVLDTERMIFDVNDVLVAACNVANSITATVSTFAM